MDEREIYRNVPYEVYKNMFALAEHRGLVIKSKRLAEKDFNERQDYVVETDKTVFTQLGAHIGGDMKAGDISKIAASRIKRGVQGDHHMFVINIDMNDPKVITVLAALTRDFPKMYIEVITYDQLQFCIPECDAFIRHEVVNAKDPNLHMVRASGTKLPDIYSTDIGVVWAGARVGDVVRIYRPDMTIAYRRVVAERLDTVTE